MCLRLATLRSLAQHAWPLFVVVLVVVASLVPITWPVGRDSFPLTSYPMFSGHRESAKVQLVLVVGETSREMVVLPKEATGHRQVTQAARALSNAAAAGGERAGRLCQEAAAWVAGSTRSEIRAVLIVTAAFDGAAYFADGDRDPRVVAEHARCPVGA